MSIYATPAREIIVISDSDSDSGDSTTTERTIGSRARRRRQDSMNANPGDTPPPSQRRCLRSLLAEPNQPDRGIHTRWQDEESFWDPNWRMNLPLSVAPIAAQIATSYGADTTDATDGDTEDGDLDSTPSEQANSDDEAAIDDEDVSTGDSQASYAPSESGDNNTSVSSSSSSE
jgi:hypothetical protein